MQNVMSALPPKADMCGALAHVRFVPIADIAQIAGCLIAEVNMHALTGTEIYGHRVPSRSSHGAAAGVRLRTPKEWSRYRAYCG